MQPLEQKYQRRPNFSRCHLLLYLLLSTSSFQPSYVIANVIVPNSLPSTFVSKHVIFNKKGLHHRFVKDHSCIDAVSRGGDSVSGDDDDNTNKDDTEASFPSPAVTTGSTDVTETSSEVETTIVPPSNDTSDAPPPPPPFTSAATFSASSTTAATAVSTDTKDIQTASVTTASAIKDSLNDGRRQIVQTIRTTYQNVKPYIPVNENYTMKLQHHIMIPAILLAMNSGYLNGLGLFGLAAAVAKATSSSSSSSTSTVPTSQAVAAVTGAFTNVGWQLARGNMGSATIPLRSIFSYLMGSFVTGYIVHHTPSTPYNISTYPVSMIFASGTIALLMASSMLSSNTITLNVFYLLTFVNGLQNGFTSIYSSNQVRSTHYSGMTSDTGTFLGQYIRSYISSMASASNERKKDLLPKIYRNAILATSFIVGGILSYWISQHGGGNANSVLLPSLLLYMALTIASLLWKPTTSVPQTSPALQ